MSDITNGLLPDEENQEDGNSLSYIKGSDFDGNGLKLTVVGMEVITPTKGTNGEDYGAKNTYGVGGKLEKENFLIKKGVLKEGQSFRYNFTQDNIERYYDNSSVGFFFAVKEAKLEKGDIVNISRDKISNFNVKWSITKE